MHVADRAFDKANNNWRQEIKNLPHERQEWLAKELKYDSRLLDYNPGLLRELGELELIPGQRSDGKWDPGCN